MKIPQLAKWCACFAAGAAAATFFLRGYSLLGNNTAVSVEEAQLKDLEKEIGDERLARLVRVKSLQVEIEESGHIFFVLHQTHGFQMSEQRLPVFFDPFTGYPVRFGPPAKLKK